MHVRPALQVMHKSLLLLSFTKKLSEMTFNLLAQHKHTGTQEISCVNELTFMFF